MKTDKTCVVLCLFNHYLEGENILTPPLSPSLANGCLTAVQRLPNGCLTVPG